jgi:hypothetical protein
MLNSDRLTPTECTTLVNAFPDINSPSSFTSEYDRWLVKWRSSIQAASTVTGFVDACVAAEPDLFPNIHLILKISAIRPSSNAGNERTFSALKRLKTFMRSTMRQDRLNGLSLMHINQDLPINIDVLIDRFARLGPHRLAFL